MRCCVIVLLLAACGGSAELGLRVRTVAGEAVSGAVIEIRDAAGLVVRGKTGADGVFVLERPPVGVLEITVRHPALAEPHVERTDGTRAVVDIEVQPVATAHGRVVDEHGAPVKGTDVFVRVRRSLTVRTITDDDGRYTAAAPPRHDRGTIEAAAAAPGCLPRFVTPERKEVLLGKARYAMPDIVLTFAGLAQGRVVSLDGSPVAGAEVRILAIAVDLKALGFTEIPERLPELGRYGAGSHYRDDPFSYLTTGGVTDAAGRYALTVPKPERVLVVVAARPGGPPRRLDLVPESLERPLPDLEVPPLSEIRVQVVRPDGDPLVPAFVELSWSYPNVPLALWTSERMRSDDEGRVLLPCAEPGVAYTVMVIGGGGMSRLKNHVLDPAQPLVSGKR